MAYDSDREKWHKLLFAAHSDLTAAAEKLHRLSVSLHEKARHSEDRAILGQYIREVQASRDSVDTLWLALSDTRTRLFGVTGCSGECK